MVYIFLSSCYWKNNTVNFILMIWFGTVLLFHSSQALVEGHFSCAEQGGVVGWVVKVLLAF